MLYIDKLIREQGATILDRTERTIVSTLGGHMTAIYVIPRDFVKDDQSATIKKKEDYTSIERFFRSHNSDSNFVLIAYGVRSGLRYTAGKCFYIMVPKGTVDRVYSRPQTTINIGTSKNQMRVWMSEGIEYHPMSGKVWNIDQSMFHNKEYNGGHLNWKMNFGPKEWAILQLFGFQKPQWFSLRSQCLIEGEEHYIGVGKAGSLAYSRCGVWYTVTKKANKNIIKPVSVNKDGVRSEAPALWTSLEISITNNDQERPSQLLLIRVIEAGWFEGLGDFEEQEFLPPPPIEEPADWDFDGQHLANYRKEQINLRRDLLNGRTEAPCVICGEVYPEDMLWAAHIKKRSECFPEERADKDNIAALMCKMGCDDLFEKGYIGVKQGEVVLLRPARLEAMQSRLLKLQGRECTAWRDKTKAYFEWHVNFFRTKYILKE